MIRVIFGATLLILSAWALPTAAQPSNASPSDAGTILPPDFHGRINYFGNHSGEVIAVTTFAGGPKKDCPRPDHKCPERIGGSLQVELEFDGDIVKGTFRGTGGLRDSALIGRRVGPDCHLYDLTDGSVWDGRCDSQIFRGTVKSVPNAQVQIALSFEALGTRVRDYAEWDRRRHQGDAAQAALRIAARPDRQRRAVRHALCRRGRARFLRLAIRSAADRQHRQHPPDQAQARRL
ncbi:MAG: hypothetical protein WDN44_02285 [Sphingomonas sp.]